MQVNENTESGHNQFTHLGDSSVVHDKFEKIYHTNKEITGFSKMKTVSVSFRQHQ